MCKSSRALFKPQPAMVDCNIVVCKGNGRWLENVARCSDHGRQQS